MAPAALVAADGMSVHAGVIVAVLAPVFLAAAAWGWRRNRVAARTWLTVGAVFAAAAAWLCSR